MAKRPYNKLLLTFYIKHVHTVSIGWYAYVQGVPKKRSRYKKVHSFVNKTDISKIFYTLVVLSYLIHNMTSNLLAGASLASDVITNL